MSSAIPITLAPDPVFPQRDRLLDPTTLLPRLAAHLGLQGPLHVDRGERLRAKYRIGESLRLVHRLQVQGNEFLVATRTFPRERSAVAYQHAARMTVPCGPLRAVAYDAEYHTVIWTFPNDRKLLQLHALQEIPAALKHLLERPWHSSRLVAYAPEKSATAQCLDAAGDTLAYAKVYAGGEGQEKHRIHQALWQSLPPEDPDLQLPRAIAYCGTYQALFLAPALGQRLDTLGASTLEDGLQRFGAALARFHTLPPVAALRRFTRLDLSRLQHAADLLIQMCPEAEELAQSLVQGLLWRWQGPTEPWVCLHGDVHLKNGMLTERGVALIDLDQAARGPAAADLGSVLAGIHYGYRIGLYTDATARALRRALLTGYSALRPLPSEAALGWYTAAALLVERALRALNRLRPLGLLHLQDILADALTVLA